MTKKLAWTLWTACVLPLLGACSVGTIYERYGAAGAVIVTIDCHSSYEVYENLRDRTMLVRTNVAAGVGELVCKPNLPPGAPSRSGPWRAAERHFENTKRPKCRIVEERSLTPMHSEFSYVCAP